MVQGPRAFDRVNHGALPGPQPTYWLVVRAASVSREVTRPLRGRLCTGKCRVRRDYETGRVSLPAFLPPLPAPHSHLSSLGDAATGPSAAGHLGACVPGRAGEGRDAGAAPYGVDASTAGRASRAQPRGQRRGLAHARCRGAGWVDGLNPSSPTRRSSPSSFPTLGTASSLQDKSVTWGTAAFNGGLRVFSATCQGPRAPCWSFCVL